ncbi:MAG: hypothetical protein IPO92_18635 [Saprospiraceae bacterium]|nr:hypothetical protein [Saprospiraceae bacterium]
MTVLPASGNCVLPTSLNITATDPDGDPVIIRYTVDGTTVTLIKVPFGFPNTPPPTSFVESKTYDDELAASNEVVRTYTNTNNPLFSVTLVSLLFSIVHRISRLLRLMIVHPMLPSIIPQMEVRLLLLHYQQSII